MEPYRPFVDRLVKHIYNEFKNVEELNVILKRKLLTIPTLDVIIGGKKSPLMVAAGLTTSSLAKCFNGKEKKILYPVVSQCND